MQAFKYILFIGAIICAMILLSFVIPTNPLIDSALEADRLINNSRIYAKEHAYRRSLSHLENAIRAMEDIQQNLNADEQETIEVALQDLRKVSNEIKMKKPLDMDMHLAFAKALNALTYAELKVTEHLIESDQYNEAKATMKYGKIHIEHALNFINSKDKEYELHLYQEIDSLLRDKSKNKETILKELGQMEAELNTFVTH